MVAYKRAKNLKELLTRVDPYNIINKVDDEMHTYAPCKKRCDVIHVRTLWQQKVVSNILLQKQFTKLDSLPHVFPKM